MNTLHSDILNHLHAGGDVWIVTPLRQTGPYRVKHASMFTSQDGDSGVYVQHGKRRVYCLPDTVVFN